MGKTGSVNWMQVKGVKGQVRLVPQKDAEVKKPGPNQRFKPNAGTRFAKSAEEEARQGRPAGRGRGGRGRGGREKDPRLRRRIRRSKSAIMGAKSKAKK
ncbi:MAG: DUF5350 domain-containing protein [Methanomicrobiales archaeon]|nr:DUF5350 domain-containing protein [Methanomicrobiales archaeon]MDD1669874.1 DUF5350 domain-containing protein [Methanomicrobiales archaeon]